MAHLVMARLGLGQTDAAWKMLARLAKEFPESKSLPPARLRVAEAALEAHQAERAAEQFKLVAGTTKAGAGGASSPAVKPVDATHAGTSGTSLPRTWESARRAWQTG